MNAPLATAASRKKFMAARLLVSPRYLGVTPLRFDCSKGILAT